MHTHADPLRGESLAADKAARGAPALRKRIYAEIEAAGPGGLTPDEFAARHKALINTVRRRFTDLWKDGYIRHHLDALHRENGDGNPCVAWVIGRDPNLATGRALHDVRILELTPPGIPHFLAITFARAIEAEVR